jgi:hypothetical protein
MSKAFHGGIEMKEEDQKKRKTTKKLKVELEAQARK